MTRAFWLCADMKKPAGVMSEEVLAEKEATIAGGAAVAAEAAASRNSMSERSGDSAFVPFMISLQDVAARPVDTT